MTASSHPTPIDHATANRISKRVGAVAPSATLAIDAKAKAMKASGLDIIGFGAGEPDFPTPELIVQAAIAACSETVNHRYTPISGLPELRKAVAAKTLRDSAYAIAPEQVLISNGGKQAIANAFATVIDPGDEVLIPAPYWTTYPESVALAGGIPITVPTDESTGFQVTPELLDQYATPRTKMVVFVSPSNPTGAVYNRAGVQAIGQHCVDRGWWVLTDEIYEHLVYGSAEAPSMPVVVPEIADRCIVVNGVAKTYAMTGWRVGWMIGPVDVINAATNLQSHETSNVNNVAQRAAIAALEGDLSAVAMMREAFDIRRKTIYQMLNEIPGVSCFEPEGAFYAFPSFKGVLGKSINGRRPASTLELAEIVLDEAEVAFVPGEAFGAPGYGRFSYALADKDMQEGVRRVGELLSKATD